MRNGVGCAVRAVLDSVRHIVRDRRAVRNRHAVGVDLVRPHRLRQIDAELRAHARSRRQGDALIRLQLIAAVRAKILIIQRPVRRRGEACERGHVIDRIGQEVEHGHVVGIRQRVDMVRGDNREGDRVTRVTACRRAVLGHAHIVFHNAIDFARGAQGREAIRHAHHVGAAARVGIQPDVGPHIQRHKLHAQQEVVVQLTGIRRVGDRGERESDRLARAVDIHRLICRRIRIRHHHIGFHKLRAARRDFKLISLARVRQIGGRIRAHEVNARRHGIRQHQVRHHALRHVHANLVNEPLANRPVIAVRTGRIVHSIALARREEILADADQGLGLEHFRVTGRVVIQSARPIGAVTLVAVLGIHVQRFVGRHGNVGEG